MLSRRSLLSCALAPAVIAAGAGLWAPGSARSATPDFGGADGWFNTSNPLTIAGLRGKVVLVEFCTYTCINWRRTLPYVNRWHRDYGTQGLQIIGVHTPEFSFERVRPNIESVLHDLGVAFPIAQDNEFRVWNAWSNRAWPSFYLLDGAGQIRLVREGEGHAQEIEGAIRSLLGLGRQDPSVERTGDADLSRIGTPEMYFGSLHPTPQDRAQSPRQGGAAYSFNRLADPALNEYQLDGTWLREQEPLILRSSPGKLRLRFSAAKLHLVAGAPQVAPVRVTVDGGQPWTANVSTPTLYTLVDGDRYGEHLIELECPAPGLSLYSATFG